MGRSSSTVHFLQLCIKRQKRQNNDEDDARTAERMTTPQQHPQHAERAIVHRGWLQQKIYKNGTLLRKKKVFYENELFVVLTLHNGCVPRLEWFAEQSAIFERRPLKSKDLTDCQFVNVSIGDERCLSIGFVDGSAPVLELLAPSVDERVQWVDILRTTLRRLNLLSGEHNAAAQQQRKENTNEYVVLAGTATTDDGKPSTSSSAAAQHSLPSTKTRPNGGRSGQMARSPRVPLAPLSPTHLRTHSTEGPMAQNTFERVGTHVRAKNSLDESMPLVRQHSAQQMQSHWNGAKTEDNTCGTVDDNSEERHPPPPSSATENGDDVVDVDSAHPLAPPPLPPRAPRQNTAQCPAVGSLPLDTVPPLPKSPIPLSPALNLCHYEMLNAPSSPSLRSHYDQIPPAGNRQSQCSVDTFAPIAEVPANEQSSTPQMAHYDVLCAAPSSAQYEVLNVPSSPQNRDFDTSTITERIFRDALSRTRRLCFSFTLLTEHIAFVELFDKVWVAGWTSAVDLRMRENGFTLNFGDEVERIDGSEVRSLKALNEIYQRIMPGAQIPLLLRSNPTMAVFTLVKPENAQQNLGIKFNRASKFLLRQPFDCLTIDSICPKSSAQKANLPSTVPAYLHQPASHSCAKAQQSNPFPLASPSSPNLLPSGGSDRAVVTHLDGVPLNPFGARDQFFRRLDSVLVGHSFNLTLHSADFCARLARQMKNQLGGNKWRHFVHAD